MFETDSELVVRESESEGSSILNDFVGLNKTNRTYDKRFAKVWSGKGLKGNSGSQAGMAPLLI